LRRAAAAALLACAACALPVVSAGTFLPAGDLNPGDLHASISLEAGRVLAGPRDVHDLPATPPEAQPWEVSTWFASDLSLRWQATRRLALEGQLKLTNPIVPFTPALVGGSVGGRVRVLERTHERGLAIELAARAVGVAVQQRLERSKDDLSQTDHWDYRAFGVEVPAVATFRVNPLFAVTASPFLRAYWIRAWHTKFVGLTKDQTALQWSPVLSGGLGVSAALDLGPVQIAPGMAIELATRPGPNAPTHFLFEPGVSLGTRF
jgi:hypothetical protein